MSKNAILQYAKNNKNDEFYTQYEDIEAEMNAYVKFNPTVFQDKTILLPCDDPDRSNFVRYFVSNFMSFGLKKLIATSYRMNAHGKKLVFTKAGIDKKQLDGNGDFRSKEVTDLKNEADIIITNPPFSLFREFLAWVKPKEKLFSIIGNVNAITYKSVWPLIMSNYIWLGESIHSGDREFMVPKSYPLNASGYRIDTSGNKYIRVKGVRWFTNINHGRRHQPLSLMTMADNIKFSKHKQVRGHKYAHYDNYDAIEVPFTDAIPSDYDGVMGVPITFLDKYNPDQFELVEIAGGKNLVQRACGGPKVGGRNLYRRISIKRRDIRAIYYV
ncbi:DNA methyltransferase [Lacticaseibacillus paracasei]|uniref:adenine-specific methyltransferase EcoRI family protein n=1 Tax=Lacticaseibacillus paracasei TaxID=1597 RepID=UPI0022EC82AC|nr:adenine-specific methyltransferase EcoRI family protein [Lacticaseibacillus paracasei]WBT00345.1 DNA methyltransferase [Lacticaseibacillus paracasei]